MKCKMTVFSFINMHFLTLNTHHHSSAIPMQISLHSRDCPCKRMSSVWWLYFSRTVHLVLWTSWGQLSQKLRQLPQIWIQLQLWWLRDESILSVISATCLVYAFGFVMLCFYVLSFYVKDKVRGSYPYFTLLKFE